MGWQTPICQKGRRPLLGWQTPICQKDRRPLRKKYALRHLPNRNSATHSLRKSSVGTIHINDGFQTGEHDTMMK